jgi:hypothetical protein
MLEEIRVALERERAEGRTIALVGRAPASSRSKCVAVAFWRKDDTLDSPMASPPHAANAFPATGRTDGRHNAR